MFGTYGFGFRGRVQAALGRGHVRPLVAAQGLYFPARGASLSTGALTAGAVFGARDHGRGLYVRITPTAAPPGGDRECTRLRRVVKWLPDEPRAS